MACALRGWRSFANKRMAEMTRVEKPPVLRCVFVPSTHTYCETRRKVTGFRIDFGLTPSAYQTNWPCSRTMPPLFSGEPAVFSIMLYVSAYRISALPLMYQLIPHRRRSLRDFEVARIHDHPAAHEFDPSPRQHVASIEQELVQVCGPIQIGVRPAIMPRW